ncbi:hypothetical protein [Microscilla marina]|uniref:Uncharacterized protein n=1 Tax=Microscilla marina ATCC 23134 TaxID=313606 RepID=A1ZLI8_MICM2|nr:hypothetical protein [Microscilla marina]EAY28742.1 hypothetical protein M23134_07840 [Microscilla marina ATCC 23134]
MNRLEFKSGGQPFLNRDFKFQFDQLFKSIEDQYKGKGAFVLSGCETSGTSISAGLVYIDGKILEFDQVSGITFPSYIKQSAPVQHEERFFVEDAANKTTRINYHAELVTSPPTEGEHITVSDTAPIRTLKTIMNEPSDPVHVVGSPGEPSFQNGWLVSGAEVYFYKDRGRVYIGGGVRGGTADQAIFTLPEEYRPLLVGSAARFGVVGMANGGAHITGYVTIGTNGEVSCNLTTSVWLILEGISFRAP